MSKNRDFRASNLSSLKNSIPQKKTKKSVGKIFIKTVLVIIWVIVIFFLSVWMISWFKWFFDTVKQSVLSSVSKTVWEPMQRD